MSNSDINFNRKHIERENNSFPKLYFLAAKIVSVIVFPVQ